ncbi:uncharacterized protein PGTG_15912 [Puccinia graminis f. sp. tritici CRL 75-36-700-3]|uniref:FAD dependent oxidoreductase domain-containing protein n=1 Tax=Puccinia graminis f. sp. tritici (strain CRL 75-36-700-3 / race SCCL) TaxID=418459 RepID=E3L0G6_PUCGT|nr:uncharacterized protein PGTG_15912 [Puccinia graminis f. sp. tritici CRL 75-36-700-3]EFP90064.2 hypothetical protein PGTG_15912 [Puccinia graminis f. sp. tritici CRL 75-36-700-3]
MVTRIPTHWECLLLLFLIGTSMANQTSASHSELQQSQPDGVEDWKSELPSLDPIPSWWMKEYHSPLASHGQYGRLPDRSAQNTKTTTIIGTGITGISCALNLVNSLATDQARNRLKLKENPINIVLVEAREFCSGATGRNGGHLTASAILGTKTRAEKFSAAEAIRAVKLELKSVKDLLDLIHSHDWKDDVDLVEGGNVHIYNDHKEQAQQMDQLQFANSLGLDLSGIHWLDKQAAVQAYGLRSSSVGALKIPGNNLFPSKLMTKIYNLIQSKASLIDGLNIELFTHTAVRKIERSAFGKPNWMVDTSRGKFESKYVVHATNAYASYLLPQLRAHHQQIIVPTRAQVIAVQPKSSNRSQVWTSGFSANEGYDYLFQRPFRPSDKRSADPRNPVVILGGGRNHAPPQFEVGIGDDSRLNGQVGTYLRSFLPQWFPSYYGDLDNGDVVHEWPGIMGFTKDHDPIVGHLVKNGSQVEGQFIAAGYSGHGMSRAPGCAEVVASMIFSELMSEKWSVPDWFPTHYLTVRP